jgi:monoamine oxidase
VTAPFPRVAILGGGPGGLISAYLLEKRLPGALRITLYEASGRLGGKLLSPSFKSCSGLHYEAGAAEFYDYSQHGPDPLKELIAELGLETSPMCGGTVFLDGKILGSPDDLGSHFGAKAAASLSRFDQLARDAISPADYYESDWRADRGDPLARKRFDELLADISEPAVRRYLRTVTHSDLACEPHQTSASYGLQNYLLDSPDYMRLYGINGGNEKLTRELARRISATVLLRHPVQRVRRATGTPEYLVESRGPEGTREDAFDFVVAALPNDCLPTIRWQGATLERAMEEHHQFYDRPAHYLRVTALFERPFWREFTQGSFFMIDAFGGTCLYDESSRFDAQGHGVLGWLLSGEDALRLSNLPDAALIETVLEALPPRIPRQSARLLEAQVHRWANSVNGLPGGFPAREPDSRHQPDPTGAPELFVVGDYLFDATINGVLDSADTVSEWIVSMVDPTFQALG